METGAGGMPVMRITTRLSLAVAAGDLEYEDHNYAGRAGWKEIVIASGPGAAISKATAHDRERSQGLTAYPQDPTVAPPQDLQAKLTWSVDSPAIARKKAPEFVPVEKTPAPAPAAPVTASTRPGQNAPGTVVRGDFLSQLLHRGEMSGSMILIGLSWLSVWAPSTRSRLDTARPSSRPIWGEIAAFKHAIFLGAMVTFTHTFSVFCLGLATLYLYRDVLPDNVVRVLGAISGLSIVWIGLVQLFKRARALSGHGHEHHHHDHDHPHDHDHVHGTHDDGPGGHSHVIEGDITFGSLIALGASGGLVPCESALVLLLSAIALECVGLGLLLLVSFSLGLAAVLMGIGTLVFYAKNLLPEKNRTAQNAAFRVIPILSAAVIICLGLLMTGVSLGVIRPSRFIG